jgi:hypothetical protein
VTLGEGIDERKSIYHDLIKFSQVRSFQAGTDVGWREKSTFLMNRSEVDFFGRQDPAPAPADR